MSYDSDNIFAKIIRKELPADIVYEDPSVLVIRDIRPAAPSHLLVMTKKSYISFDDFALMATPTEFAAFFSVVRKVASDFGLSSSGYRIVANHGRDGGQEIPHFHVHILGGKRLSGL